MRCWTHATRCSDGYVRTWVDGRSVYVHRAAYEVLVGPIPDGFEVDHLCGVRNCYNPAHLEAVTKQENTRRVWDPTPSRYRSPRPTRPVRHGTLGAYTNRRCRCDLCRATNATATRKRRLEKGRK